MQLDAKVPPGPVEDKWDNHKFSVRLVNPANKRKFKILIVGTGLAGASAAASLAELGYDVEVFTFHDSPRRAHSIAAQGGINAAKNYKNDGDSVYRLFYDTVKGGDYRSREANVYRLAHESLNIIDQATAQGVPFAREYGGLLDNRSFGGRAGRTHVLRPGPDGPAAPPRGVPGDGASGGGGHGEASHPVGDARHRGQGRQGGGHRRPRLDLRGHHEPFGSRSGPCHRRLQQRLLPLHECHGLQRQRNLESTPERSRLRQSFLHPDPPDLHPRFGRVPVEADIDVRVAAK